MPTGLTLYMVVSIGGQVGLENSSSAHWQKVFVCDTLVADQTGSYVVVQVEIVNVLVQMRFA